MSFRKQIAAIIAGCRGKNPGEAEIRFDEPMASHTAFRVGGPADCWLRPEGEGFPTFAASALAAANDAGVPVFILGGGANLVVSDKGIRGLVLDTSGWSGGITIPADESGAGGEGTMLLRFRAGTAMDDAAEQAAAAGLSGLEFLAGMPGSIGGAVWMNARCYGREIAGVLVDTETIDYRRIPCGQDTGVRIQRLPADKSAFGYKRSPFQDRPALIVSAAFSLRRGDTAEIRRQMAACRTDREAKGHYRFPCAGSVFKNNRAFGKPAGQIIDELGLKGLRIGGAQVAPFHGNIIINTGGASAADIRALAGEVAERVKAATGFVLEPEIIFAGEW